MNNDLDGYKIACFSFHDKINESGEIDYRIAEAGTTEVGYCSAFVQGARLYVLNIYIDGICRFHFINLQDISSNPSGYNIWVSGICFYK